MRLDAWIFDAAERHPQKQAIVAQDAKLTYGDFAVAIETRAQQLRQSGLVYGQRLAWYGLNQAEAFILLFACARLGALFMPLNWRLALPELQNVLKQGQPRLLISDDNFADAAQKLVQAADDCQHFPMQALQNLEVANSDEAVSSDADLESALLLVYTSGSTGVQKGVVLRQKALVANAKMSVEAQNMQADDQVLSVLPLFHVGGLNIIPTPAFSIGATVVLLEKFEPATMLLALQNVQSTVVVPTLLTALMASPGWRQADLSALRSISIGSTDVPLTLIEALEARGVPMIQVYGATETAPYAIYQKIDEAWTHKGSIGRIGSQCQARLVKQDGEEAEVNEVGEIWIKGDNCLAGYWEDLDNTKLALCDGWFKTEDMARKDDQDFYWFADRKRHMIISGGENIFPTEIERVLAPLPGVEALCVVGKTDERWGQVPVAVIVGQASRAVLQAALDKSLARYKHPKHFLYWSALPRNAMGKVLVDQVREKCETMEF